MEEFSRYLFLVKNIVWSTPLFFLLFGVGVYLTFLLRGVQFRYLGYALKQVISPKDIKGKGDISNFQALMTALAGAIGTGSISGIATSVAIGGMGALFWMWLTAIIGMATKYSESLLAVKYREVDHNGEMVGGPMEYIGRGLGWKKTAIMFSIFGVLGSMCTGNLVQVNSIAEALHSTWHFNPWIVGVVLAVVTSVVILGGVKAIGNVACIFVPVMALFYIAGGLIIIFINYQHIPAAVELIFTSAFSGQAAIGGFAGSSVMMAVQSGVSRSIFSNEAGLGIPSIAAAAARTDYPGRQAMISMTGALISTVIVCTITGLVIGTTQVLGTVGANGKMLSGASLVIRAFEEGFSGGTYVVTISTILFAYSTVLAWGYYGEKCFEYLCGERGVMPFRILYILLIIPGSAWDLEVVWSLADIANGLMSIPNLIALAALSGVILTETRSFLKVADKEIAEG